MRTTVKQIRNLFLIVADLYGWNTDKDSGEAYLYLEKSTPGAWWEIACHQPSRPHVPAYPFGCGGRKAADMETWLRGMMDAWHAQHNSTFSIPRDYRKRDTEQTDPGRCDAAKVAIKINAGNCSSGNPRRGWLVYGVSGRYLGFTDEGYTGWCAVTREHGINVRVLGTVACTPGEYRGYERNPSEHARPLDY